jgi:hypothetical protein
LLIYGQIGSLFIVECEDEEIACDDDDDGII